MAQQVSWTDGKTYTWDASQNSFTLGGQKVADTLNKQLIERYNAQGAPDGKLFSSSGTPTGKVFNDSQTPDGNVFTGGEESGFDKFQKGLGIAYDIGNLGIKIANGLAGNKIADSRVRTVRDPTAAYDRANADLNREQAGKYQQAEQRDMQIAKGNYRAEGDRDAASKAAAMSNQKLNQMSASAGSAGAALDAKTEVAPEYDQYMARADAAHQRAVQYGADATEEQQDANVARAAADKKDYDVAQINSRNRDALIASMPQFKPQTYATKEGTSTTKKQETPPAEQKSEEPKQEAKKYSFGYFAAQRALNKLVYGSTASESLDEIQRIHPEVNTQSTPEEIDTAYNYLKQLSKKERDAVVTELRNQPENKQYLDEKGNVTGNYRDITTIKDTRTQVEKGADGIYKLSKGA